MTKEQILTNVNFDIDKAKAIYEWLDGETSKEPTTNHDAIIEVYHSDELDGVRVQALGEDFVIGLHDLDNGKNNFTYDEAMSRLKEIKFTATLNRKRAGIICIYIDEINYKLIEAGGEPFAEAWYATKDLYIPKDKRSSADYNADFVWCLDAMDGYLNNTCRFNYALRCRPVYQTKI